MSLHAACAYRTLEINALSHSHIFFVLEALSHGMALSDSDRLPGTTFQIHDGLPTWSISSSKIFR